MTTLKSSCVLALLMAFAAPAAADPPCYAAEPLATGLGYHVGNGIALNGKRLQFVPFTSSTGQQLSGRGEVKVRNVAGASMKGFQLGKITARFTSQPAVTTVIVRYVDFGGGVNLRINNQSLVATRLLDLHGQTIGGVAVQVTETQALPRVGTLRLTGAAPTVAVGGAELLLREACF